MSNPGPRSPVGTSRGMCHLERRYKKRVITSEGQVLKYKLSKYREGSKQWGYKRNKDGISTLKFKLSFIVTEFEKNPSAQLVSH